MNYYIRVQSFFHHKECYLNIYLVFLKIFYNCNGNTSSNGGDASHWAKGLSVIHLKCQSVSGTYHNAQYGCQLSIATDIMFSHVQAFIPVKDYSTWVDLKFDFTQVRKFVYELHGSHLRLIFFLCTFCISNLCALIAIILPNFLVEHKSNWSFGCISILVISFLS